jgi:hypothetical protein
MSGKAFGSASFSLLAGFVNMSEVELELFSLCSGLFFLRFLNLNAIACSIDPYIREHSLSMSEKGGGGGEGKGLVTQSNDFTFIIYGNSI